MASQDLDIIYPIDETLFVKHGDYRKNKDLSAIKKLSNMAYKETHKSDFVGAAFLHIYPPYQTLYQFIFW